MKQKLKAPEAILSILTVIAHALFSTTIIVLVRGVIVRKAR
jgi:hypothetical protein